MKFKLLLALLFAILSSPSALAASDVVILTWERGLEQSITVGGATDASLWNLELRGKGRVLTFTRSVKNSSGYFLYTLTIPENFPKGRYEVYSSAINREEQLTSYVDIVDRKSFDPIGDAKKFGYLGTVALSLFTLIATARNEDFQTLAIRRRREEVNADEKNDPLSVDFKDNLIEIERRGLFDRIGYGKINWIAKLDAWRFSLSHKLPRTSPMAGRFISDASWIQALFGPLVLLTPIAGLTIGYLLASETNMTRTLVPSNLTLIVFGLILGIVDAFAGALIAMVYFVWALASGNLVNAIDLRTVLAVSIIFCGPLLLMGKIRPLRREKENWSFVERLTDVLVVGALTVVTVKALITSLDSLSQQTTILATYATYFALIAGVAVPARYIIEDIADRLAPARLNYLIPTSIPDQEPAYAMGAVLIKVGMFVLFLLGFFDISWQLCAGIATLIIVELVKYFRESLPNSPFIFQVMPSGIPQMVMMALIGIAVGSWVNSLPLVAADRSKTTFVLVAIPGFVISLIKFFGRSPREGDVKWYCRPRWRFLYYSFGPIMTAAALGLQLGVFS